MGIFLVVSGVVLGIIGLVLLLLSVKVGVYAEFVYTKKDGFSFNGKITWLFLKKPMGGSDIDMMKILEHCIRAAKDVVHILVNVLTFKKQCVWCKVALKDPMKNGIAYGRLSGALIAVTQVITSLFPTKEYKVRATPDFSSGDGISIKDVTWVQVRPIKVIIYIIRGYTKSPALRKAVKGILNELTKKKGSNEK